MGQGAGCLVDLVESSPLTRSGMTDFVLGQVVADAAKRKYAKYRDLCAAKGYGFLLSPSRLSGSWKLMQLHC